MSTNVTYEYGVAEKEYLNASTKAEKLIGLEKMLQTVPKHKGTEKMVMSLKIRISKLKTEIMKEKLMKKGGGKSIYIKKEGAAQFVLVGMTGSGRSSLLSSLTNAQVEVAEYPFTTKEPVPGMMEYKGMKIQIIELPAVVKGSSSGKFDGLQVLSMIRNADGVGLVIDLSRDVDEQMRTLITELENQHLRLNQRPKDIRIKRKTGGGYSILGQENLPKDRDIKQVLKDMGVHNAEIIANEKVELEDILNALNESAEYKAAMIIATKGDLPDTTYNYDLLVKRYGSKFAIHPVSTETKARLDELKKGITDCLRLIRVYTKQPGEEADLKEPIPLREGATIEDAAMEIHKDLVNKFTYAKLWGSGRFPGQTVGLDYSLKDGDIIEIHTK